MDKIPQLTRLRSISAFTTNELEKVNIHVEIEKSHFHLEKLISD